MAKQIYKLLNVTKIEIYKEGNIYILKTYNKVFKID